MGVMYYSRYYEYYEAARTDMMRALGMTYKELETTGIMMPVIHSESDYLRGPEFDDALICQARVLELHRNRMEIHYRIFKADAPDDLLNQGKTVHAFVKMNGRPTRIPADLLALFQSKWESYE
jgi:acyl-CoA thioester hydrolase